MLECSDSSSASNAADTSCGCVGDCCNLCDLAAAAARPRLLSRDVAVEFVPPDLKALRYKPEQRNADTGEAMLWYWQ